MGLVYPGRSFYRVDGIEFCRWNQSNIVPTLPAGGVVTGLRSDTDYIVTEHGVASLRNKDVNETAQALIGVAAPEHRDMLQAAWRELQK